MKHGKAPTKAQKILLKSYGFDPANWLFIKNTSKEIIVTHRHTSTTRIIPKQEAMR